MKRLLYGAALLLSAALFLEIGAGLYAWIPVWPLAEAAALVLVLAAALVLPGRPVLWVELLGTAATLPVLYHILPWKAVIPAFTIAPDFLLYGLYLVLLLLLSTVGPLFLLLLFGGWLE